ncbi:uncharacterized protein ACLA_098810 [Aspergillus clavatus NRRL 1]|uniref:Uncharacterized protein n=1 Tax=Aspergillus clavatus (strain ATCC 1007 / CBS 513.65 / DSM 816 / NCTC 3887 / NRRL 1 / QM 1276 / 107) TaxID=344612 RepID=A1CN02_ASPCL|nr:uncharacterized protein ACLA_098810 [Aspergillus clavatus NRRL 1]EAW08939.1 hypothetical protein ACLA_098810 [Aspergillus clavatus NRRL 1]
MDKVAAGLEIACYYGPESHVLVGTSAAIENVEQLPADSNGQFGKIEYKGLSVAHGFSSQFNEALLSKLYTCRISRMRSTAYQTVLDHVSGLKLVLDHQ